MRTCTLNKIHLSNEDCTVLSELEGFPCLEQANLKDFVPLFNESGWAVELSLLCKVKI